MVGGVTQLLFVPDHCQVSLTSWKQWMRGVARLSKQELTCSFALVVGIVFNSYQQKGSVLQPKGIVRKVCVLSIYYCVSSQLLEE